MGGDQVATVGVTELTPNLINVIAKAALLTVDLRNTSEQKLQYAEGLMTDFIRETCNSEAVSFESRTLARFKPVEFDAHMVDLVADTARSLDYRVRKMPSGAGHDAQMFAPNCPTAMIFVPSRDGISHNVAEYTEPDHLRAGANVLLQALLARSH